MKKFLGLFLATSMLFVGCGGAGNTASSETTTGEENTSEESSVQADADTTKLSDGTVIIGLDENFPPMGFRGDDGELTGFDIDLAKAAGEKMGVEVEFQPIDWGSKELELSSDKVDLLWNGLTITDSRKETMEFTNPYLDNRQIILVKEGSDIKTKADLSGKNVGIQKESSAVEAVNKDEIAPQLNLSEYPDNISAFTDLEIGRVDAVVVDEIVARYYLSQNDAKFVILDENFGAEEYGVAAKKGNTELVNKLQKALDEMSSDGTATEISKKWFGEDIYVHSK